MSNANEACLRRSREVLSGGFTTGRTATPCDMTVLEALPASYQRLTASSKLSPQQGLEVSCGTQLYPVIQCALLPCRCPYRAKAPPPPTHTHTHKNEAKGRSLLPQWSNRAVFTNMFTFSTGRLHTPQAINAIRMQHIMFVCRPVGRSNPLHCCHRLFHLHLDSRTFKCSCHCATMRGEGREGTSMLNRCTPVSTEQQRNRNIWPLTLLVTEPRPSNA